MLFLICKSYGGFRINASVAQKLGFELSDDLIKLGVFECCSITGKKIERTSPQLIEMFLNGEEIADKHTLIYLCQTDYFDPDDIDSSDYFERHLDDTFPIDPEKLTKVQKKKLIEAQKECIESQKRLKESNQIIKKIIEKSEKKGKKING